MSTETAIRLILAVFLGGLMWGWGYYVGEQRATERAAALAEQEFEETLRGFKESSDELLEELRRFEEGGNLGEGEQE